MVDYQIVCCMCGDVGFPEKLFRCNKCHNRFQHSYCSNYYSESSEPIEVCDWCKSEERSAPRNSRKSSATTGERIKQNDHHREEGSSENRGKNNTPSPRTSTRRYKLLKDVMC